MVRTNSQRKDNYMKKKVVLIFLVILSLVFSKISLAANEENLYDKIDLFGEVLDKINKEYVEEINQSDVMDAAINGVLQSLDPYSAYMSPTTFKEIEFSLLGGKTDTDFDHKNHCDKNIQPIDGNLHADRHLISLDPYQ